MCGIVGFWTRDPELGHDALEQVARRMADTLVHRGPDAGGVFVDAASGLALGHRRLAIVDLTETGAQPMASASGRYQMVLNGEIYNHGELRDALAQAGPLPRFRGTSDTEVLLTSIERWGLEGTLRRARGMFSLALWDLRERTLSLARDRFGEKPLYYGRNGSAFLFGSELKALVRYPGWSGTIDRDALSLYFRGGYIPAPFSIWQGIRKLVPGHILTMRAAGADPVLTPYWSADEAVLEARAHPFEGSGSEAARELEDLLLAVVREQMMADVPLGAFLSGGIDSSTIVALMQAQSPRPVRTFTIGFEDPLLNEADHARDVARHLGTEHTEWIITSADALQVIPSLSAIWDEPFADSSQIPTYLVSRLARSQVTVVLSGDGGDELFGGYARYDLAQLAWDLIKWCPPSVRSMGSRLLPERYGGLVSQPDARLLYQAMLAHWREPYLVQGATHPTLDTVSRASWQIGPPMHHAMMHVDTLTYLPDDILVKVDRAAMANSLESRVPLLDPRVHRLAWSLDPNLKFSPGLGKLPLRRILERYVPRSLFDRPKKGFAVPMASWLRHPLREWAEDLMDPRRLQREGYLDTDMVRHQWQAHLDGKRANHYRLWDVLMFQAWLAKAG